MSDKKQNDGKHPTLQCTPLHNERNLNEIADQWKFSN